MSFFHGITLERNDAVFFEVLQGFWIIRQVPPNCDSRQVTNEQSIRNHEGENDKTQRVERFQDKRDWDDNKTKHQIVKKSARSVGLPPPVVRLDGIDFHLPEIGKIVCAFHGQTLTSTCDPFPQNALRS